MVRRGSAKGFNWANFQLIRRVISERYYHQGLLLTSPTLFWSGRRNDCHHFGAHGRHNEIHLAPRDQRGKRSKNFHTARKELKYNQTVRNSRRLLVVRGIKFCLPYDHKQIYADPDDAYYIYWRAIYSELMSFCPRHIGIINCETFLPVIAAKKSQLPQPVLVVKCNVTTRTTALSLEDLFCMHALHSLIYTSAYWLRSLSHH